MRQTDTITCPHCNEDQQFDIYYYLDGTGEMDGSFEESCEYCEEEFTVNFELRAFIETEIGG